MKTRRIVSAVISVSISAMLLSGIQAAHDFAYYLSLAMNILGWMIFWAAGQKDSAKTMVDGLWLSLPLSAFGIYALASTGHPKLAASSFLLSLVILAISFSVLQQKDAKL